jgi:hypothetical protein
MIEPQQPKEDAMTAFKITLPPGIAVFIAGLLGAAMVGGLIAAAPPASAGCQYGGLVISKCDGPVQPDGTWQRCVVFAHSMGGGASSYLVPDRRCDLMGADQHPWGLAFADPAAHIDD